MASNLVSIERRGFGQTMRKDKWWVAPVLTFIGLGAFVVYSTWAAFQGQHYSFGNYLSPFYSPEIFGNSPHALFGPPPSWLPSWLPFSPALLILWAPAGFRMTCYYYRGAYYKAFWADPLNCAVGEPRQKTIDQRQQPATRAREDAPERRSAGDQPQPLRSLRLQGEQACCQLSTEAVAADDLR